MINYSARTAELYANANHELQLLTAVNPHRDAYLYFGLDIVDGVAAFYFEGYGLACQRLHKYLHGCEAVTIQPRAANNLLCFDDLGWRLRSGF